MLLRCSPRLFAVADLAAGWLVGNGGTSQSVGCSHATHFTSVQRSLYLWAEMVYNRACGLVENETAEYRGLERERGTRGKIQTETNQEVEVLEGERPEDRI